MEFCATGINSKCDFKRVREVSFTGRREKEAVIGGGSRLLANILAINRLITSEF